MDDSRTYKVGHEYIDDIANSPHTDQFVKWLGGMGNAGGIRPSKYNNFKSKIPSFIVLITRKINHKHHNPWDDLVDYNSSRIFYWGDAKHDKIKSYRDFEGNKTLMLVYETGLDGSKRHIPPILHFTKSKSGIVVFSGLCVITNVQTTWFEDRLKPVKNFRFELTILDADEISVDWLMTRSNSQHIDRNNDILAPASWNSVLNGRVNKLDLFKKEILTREDQLPSEGSVEAHLLESITKLQPAQFEAILVELLRSLPHVNHNITGTRLVKDGGFDFYGQFNLPFPLSYKISFLGEAKKYNRINPVSPGMVSRLVARLARGDYGLFVTTSYYTTQAQEEVIEDGYPVRLYCGLDVINFLRELKLIDGAKIKESWLNEVLKTLDNDSKFSTSVLSG